MDEETVLKFHEDKNFDQLARFKGYVKKKDVLTLINKYNFVMKKVIIKGVKKI